MSQTQAPVTVWKSPESRYVAIGEGMVFCNVIEPDLSHIHAGYLEARGGTLRWTQAGDEVIWVLAGTVRITHGDDLYELSEGNMIFMKKGISLTMTGSHDAKIAYVSHLH